MSNYRVLQLTNSAVGAVAVDGYMPFGTITRKICCGRGDVRTFEVTTSNANTIILNEVGNYRITYSGSLIAGATGEIGVTLVANSNSLYEVSGSASAVGDVVNLTLPYEIRVLPNCNSNPSNSPMTIRLQLTGGAITGGTSNILIERVY